MMRILSSPDLPATYGDTLTVSCVSGYEMESLYTVSCVGDIFSPLPTCLLSMFFVKLSATKQRRGIKILVTLMLRS